MSPTVVAALVAAIPGLLVLLLWWRGRLTLDDPYCAACGHSLRGATTMPAQCAECGTQLKRVGAVRFARRSRSARLAIAGLLVLTMLPLAAIALQRWNAARSPAAVATTGPAGRNSGARRVPGTPPPPRTNQAVIAEFTGLADARLGSIPWTEAATRVQDGKLGEEELEALIATFERWGMRKPDGARADGLGSDELQMVASELGGALAVSPQVTPEQRKRLIASWFDPIQASGALRTSTGGRGKLAWPSTNGLTGQSSGRQPAIVRSQRLRELRIDGQPVEPTKDEKRQWLLLPALPAGDHAIELDFEWVVTTVPAEDGETFTKDVDSSPVRPKETPATGPFASVFEGLDDLPEPEGRSPRRLAAGVETVRRTLVVRGPDQPLLDALSDQQATQQRSFLTKSRVDQAVVRPVGGPGQQTLQVRVVHATPGGAFMLARLVVKAGDREYATAPKVLQLRSRNARQGQQLEPITIFELDEVIEALPRDIGKIQVFIDPVPTIAGLALETTKGLTERVDLGTVTLRRADLGE